MNAGDSNVSVNAGDTVVWSWSGAHNVVAMGSNDCEDTGATVGSISGASVTLDTPGVYWYSCTIGTHCSNGGMIMSVTVN